MKEINIILNKEDINYLHYLKQTLQQNNKIKIYSAVCEINDMAVFSLATKDEDFLIIQSKLKQQLAEIIIYIYKEKFILSHLDFTKINEAYKIPLIKALVLFDSDRDKQYIKTKIDLGNDVFVESFYNFKLQALKKRWTEFISITNDNGNLLESETFLDLLKFLIATIKPKNSLVNVYFNGNSFEFKDKNLRTIKNNFLSNSSDEINLITALITLAPNNINLHCINAISNNTFKVLYYIFDKKINLLV